MIANKQFGGLTRGCSRLEVLLGGISQAASEGRLKSALRLADSACRIAPEDRTCQLVYGRLLIESGELSKAAHLLRERHDPDGLLARAELLYAQGLLDASASICEGLLSRFAADAIDNLTQFATRLCCTPNIGFPGWVGVNTELRLFGWVRTGTRLVLKFGDRILQPTISALERDCSYRFTCKVPLGSSGQISVCAGESKLLGSGLSWPPEFGVAGWVVPENKTLVGKVRMDWASSLPVRLAIGRCGFEPTRRTVLPAVDPTGGSLFSVPLDPHESEDCLLEVSAVLPDGSCSPLAGSPVEMRRVSPRPVGTRPQRMIRALRDTGLERVVDIVVPVYQGRDETLTCLESVLATTTTDQAEVVVVNDASPDPELSSALALLARDRRITLLTNQSNLGFPGAANRGINLHPDRDVVLLNADTELLGDWLERLKVAAYCEEDIGTVTPLGEAASITSYPGTSDRSHSRAEAIEIDRVARGVNARKVVEVPVGVGYCLYIKRACITETGGFDENRFAKGYGEENDFCLRARALGWRHVAATDLFVRHRGARSYGRMKEMLSERNTRILNALHPGYDAMIADFVAVDPLLDARRAIDMHRLLKDVTDPVLLVTCCLPGGVRRHVDARQADLRAEGHSVLVLQPSPIAGRVGQVILSPARALDNLAFNLPEELPILRALLLKLELSSIEVHHFAGLAPAVLELVTTLGVDYDTYVHDYSWVCPRMTLMGGNDVYCSEPPIEECESCILVHGTALEKSLTVEALRLRSSRILGGANAVIVPTDDVRIRLARYFPGLPMKVMPWEEPIEPKFRSRAAATGRVRVAVIGAISIPKGYQILLECARDAAERELDLEFVVIGFTCDDEQLLATGQVFITGPYAENEVGNLLEREQCHAAFFPSVVPETWCYALSYALARGLPIVAFDLGSIAERLRSYVAADLLPLFIPAAATNDVLLRSARGISSSKQQKEFAMEPTPTANEATVSDELSATVQLLTLPSGTYTFTVKSGGPTTLPSDKLALPALQVGLAPMQSAGEVALLAREGTSDRWLAQSSDMIVAKIFSDYASLMLTSVRLPNSPALAVDVRRLGDESLSENLQAATGETAGEVPPRIVAHIQNLGDIPFTDGSAGCIGERLWIEAFAILSGGQVAPDLIEYCGVTADGFQTPWVGNQTLCGSRGRATPMLAYAIRLKPDIADRYDCAYTGKFLSGSVVGPIKNGDLCCSDAPRDPLWGIQLRVTPRTLAQFARPASDPEHSNVA